MSIKKIQVWQTDDDLIKNEITVCVDYELKPILTPEQIEAQIFERVPVKPGEKQCKTERRLCNQLREHIRKTLRQQNINNAEYNRQLQERIMQSSG